MAADRLDAALQSATAALKYDVSAGSDRLLVANIQAESQNDALVDSVLYGDQPMVEAAELGLNDTRDGVNSIWYILEAGIAATNDNEIVPTFSGVVSGGYTIIARSYTGIEQAGGASTVPATATDSTGGGTPNPINTVDLVEVDGGLIIGSSYKGDAGTPTWGADMTEIGDILSQGGGLQASMADRLSTTNANVDIECQWSGQNRAIAVSVRFAASTGGAVNVAIPTATETDTALSITPAASGSVTVPIDTATETDAALAIAPNAAAVNVAIDTAGETDAALSIDAQALAAAVPIDVASETDTALSLAPSAAGAAQVSIDTGNEVDSALAITPNTAGAVVAIDTATELDLALSIDAQASGAATVPIDQGGEVDTAGTITPNTTGLFIPIEQASEADQGQTISPIASGAVVIPIETAFETNTARSIIPLNSSTPTIETEHRARIGGARHRAELGTRRHIARIDTMGQ